MTVHTWFLAYNSSWHAAISYIDSKTQFQHDRPEFKNEKRKRSGWTRTAGTSRGPKSRQRWRLGLVQALLRQDLALLDVAVDLALAVEDPVELLVAAPLQQA